MAALLVLPPVYLVVNHARMAISMIKQVLVALNVVMDARNVLLLVLVKFVLQVIPALLPVVNAPMANIQLLDQMLKLTSV